MKLYTFAALAILAITLAPVPPTQAGLLGSLLGGVVNTASNLVGGVANTANGLLGGVLNTAGGLVQHILLGGDRLPPNGKIVTLRGPDGKIVGHLNGDFVTLVEKFCTQPSEEIFFKLANNNREVIVTNKSGTDLARLSGSNAQGIINLALQLGGQFSLCVNRLGSVVNGAQTIWNSAGQVVDTVTQNDVKEQSGGITIVGNTLWGLVQNTPGLIDGLLLSVGNLVGGIVNGIGGLLGGILGNVVGNVNNVVGGVVNGLGNVVGGVANTALGILGGSQFLPNGDIVTIMGPDGKICGHINGDLVALVKKFTTQPGENIYFKPTSDNTEIVVTNMSGMVLTRLPGTSGQGILSLVNQLGGPISMCLSRLGSVENGIQTIFNSAGQVIDKVTQTDVNVLPGGITIVGSTLLSFTKNIKGLLDGLVGGIVNAGLGIVSGGVNVAVNILNTILNGNNEGAVGALIGNTGIALGCKVATLADAANKIRGHLSGKLIPAIELLAKRLGGCVTLQLPESDNGSVVIVNKDGKTAGLITGSNVLSIKEIIQNFGGRINITINTVNKEDDQDGNQIPTIMDVNGNIIDKIAVNAIDAINSATGNTAEKITILGNGLGGLVDNVLCLISGIVQLITNSIGNEIGIISNVDNNFQPGSPLVSVNDNDGKIIGLVLGGKFVPALLEIFKSYGANIYLSLDPQTSGDVCLTNEAGTLLGKITGNNNLVEFVQQNGGKLILNCGTVGVVTNDNGDKVAVAVDINGKPVAVISGNPISIVDDDNGDKTFVVGNPLIGSGLVVGLIGGSASASTGGQTGGQTAGLTDGQTGGQTGSQIGSQTGGQTDGQTGGTSGASSNGGLISGLLGGSGGVFGSGLLGGLLGGTGSNGGLLGGLLGGLSSGGSGANGGLLGGVTGGSGSGGLLGGLTGGSSNGGGLLGGLTGGSSNGGGLLGGLIGGSGSLLAGLTGGLLGGPNGGLLHGSSNGGLLGGLNGGSTNGGLLGGLTGGLFG